MSALTSPAERFARLIDLDNPPAFLDGGDPQMRPAVALIAALRTCGQTAPPAPLSPSARLAMREVLVAAATAESVAVAPTVSKRITHAAERGQQRAASAGRRFSRRMSAVVGSVMILTSVTGVGVATARSMPGSPFYDLKRATESVQLWFASGAAGKGQRHLEFARTRLAEAEKLPADSPYLASTLRAMNTQTRQANTDLVKAYKSTGSLQPLADLVTFARDQYADLAKLGAKLPEDLHEQAKYSAQLLTGVSQEVQSLTIGLCKKCATANSLLPKPSGAKPHPTSTPPATGHGTSTTTSPSTHPTHSPGGLLPSGLTHLLPTAPASKHHKGNPNPLPTLSPLPLLSSLVQLLGG